MTPDAPLLGWDEFGDDPPIPTIDEALFALLCWENGAPSTVWMFWTWTTSFSFSNCDGGRFGSALVDEVRALRLEEGASKTLPLLGDSFVSISNDTITEFSADFFNIPLLGTNCGNN